MLDTQTKKRIDDCRDILVGKLPDPKAQIEQITIGLIYKFMYDMDQEAVELGGQVKFFADYKMPDPEFPNDRNKDKIVAFSKYSWERLFDSKVTASEMLTLYSEAILSMDKNPNVPQLFRDIFKNAYLPYRDPETLKMFLKTIGEFEYTHSEKLGDAFEYLLSVMGSQGDAGQFRTPRHIIDFLVSAIDPDKADSIADPACGTAGFLISAYKHILLKHTKANKDSLNIYQYNKHGDQKPFNNLGDLLTPDDRKKLIQNFVGYDISPDMVRLSLVNLYLHGFAHPHIYEYDTLSSEDRWNESFDVILANPPFMTPKGGIRPHKKFGVQANKSEVLFTDYIAEHLNNNGRAGIVVPNGIVATSQTAYKQLRKMLVKDSLIAVISLPAGVFQPYSGVKTSILILDKALAKKCKHILFLKIDNDGYDLGAQRREIEKNDLPLALQTLKAYKDHLVMLSAVEADKEFNELPALATLVEKEIVLGNKDMVLSAERYFEAKISQTEFDLVKLEDICVIQSGGTPSKIDKSFWENGTIPWVGSTVCKNQAIYYSETQITELGLKKSNAKLFPKGTTLIALVGATIGKTAYLEFETTTNQNIAGLQVKDEKVLDKKYLFFISQTLYNQFFALGDGGFRMASLSFIKQLEIPLPPLEIQQQIVAEIEGYQKIIDGAKQVVNNYKPSIRVKEEWEMVELGELATNISSGATPLGGKENYKDSGILFIRSQNILWGETDFSDAVFITEETHKSMKRSQVKFEDVFLNITGASIGRSAVMNQEIEANVNQHVVFIRTIKDRLNPYFLSTFLNSPIAQKVISNAQTGAARQAINYEQIKELTIPLPSIFEQHSIVKAIEEEMQLVNANKRLIEIYEQKIKTKIGEIWGVKEEGSLSLAAEPQTEYNK
jgi:type I restriction enzyme M protein